jgi:hypothetical protein
MAFLRRPTQREVFERVEAGNGKIDKRNWRREIKKIQALWVGDDDDARMDAWRNWRRGLEKIQVLWHDP